MRQCVNTGYPKVLLTYSGICVVLVQKGFHIGILGYQERKKLNILKVAVVALITLGANGCAGGASVKNWAADVVGVDLTTGGPKRSGETNEAACMRAYLSAGYALDEVRKYCSSSPLGF